MLRTITCYYTILKRKFLLKFENEIETEKHSLLPAITHCYALLRAITQSLIADLFSNLKKK